MINLNSQFNLSEIGIWDDYLSQDTRSHHFDKSLHLFEIRMQRIRHNIVDLVG